MKIFGTGATEKIRNQNVLYFSTSPYLCFCTTWEAENPKIAPVHLNAASFLPKARKTLKCHLVTAEPPFTAKTIDWMHQTGPRILLSVIHMLYVNQVCYDVGRCVKDVQIPVSVNALDRPALDRTQLCL